MEILKTFWNVLTTENEQLSILICTPLIFVEMYISMLLFITLLNIKSDKKQKTLYVIVLSIIGLITAWLVPSPYNTFINLIVCPILVFFILKTTIFKAILAEIIQYISFAIVGLIVTNIAPVIFSISTTSFLNIPIYKFSCSLFIYLFVFLIYLFFHHYNISIFKFNNDTKYGKILFINLIIGIVSIAIQSYLVTLYNDYIPVFINILSLLILFLYFVCSLISLTRTASLEKTTKDLEEQTLYNKTLTILYDNIRGFKHDFNNIIQAIGGYISNDNISGLKEYYDGLLEDCQKSNNLSILNPELINNPAVYSLLTSKYYKAEKLGVHMCIEAMLDFSTIKMKPYELSRALGILLDNAIEAANNSAEKKINVYFRKDIKASRDLIIIENSYSNKDVNVDKIFEKGYTSKNSEAKSHGLGLWEVRQILRKNNNLNLYTTKNNEIFKQQLEIY